MNDENESSLASLREWFRQFDPEVSIELGHLTIAYSHLDFLLIAAIAGRLGTSEKPMGFLRAALITADNTFSQKVQLFRALGRSANATNCDLTRDKELAVAAIKASEKRNELVHGWYLDTGADHPKTFMHGRLKPTSKFGFDTKYEPLTTQMIKEVVDLVISVIPLFQGLPEISRLQDDTA